MKAAPGAPGGIEPTAAQRHERPALRGPFLFRATEEARASGLAARGDNEVVERILGNLPPRNVVVAECVHAVERLHEADALGGDLTQMLAGRLVAGLQQRLRKGLRNGAAAKRRRSAGGFT